MVKISRTPDTATLSDAIRRWLDTFQTGPTGRLPPERELAETFSVSRAELRKAFDVLEKEGRIWRHIGKGTFLVQPPAEAETSEQIAGRTSPLAAMEARTVVEPELARLAALHATSADFIAMRELVTAMRAAPTWAAYAELDWRFHNLIAKATGNVLLIEVQRLLNDVRRHVVWGNLDQTSLAPAPGYHSFGEHEEILAAIERRDGESAMRAMRGHLRETRAQLLDPHLA